MSRDHISLEKVRECLDRSGYLLESRLVRSLTDHGYFVEPNQIVRDRRTGKGREIDLVAEYFRYTPERPKTCVQTYFVVEAINNKYPFVLLTERPNSPGADFENYIKVICTPEPNPFISHLDIYEEKGADWKNLFSQYCVLTQKSGANKELMATHPDDVYSSLLKLSEYVEDQIHFWTTRDRLERTEFWRMFFWQPMLVLSGQLVCAHFLEDGTTQLQETTIGRLEFNWHDDDRHQTTVIEVLTEEYFLKRLAIIIDKDDEIEGKVHALREHLKDGDST